MEQYLDKCQNKVYINPNFNRTNESSRHVPNNNVMHVNPKFSHLLSNVQRNVAIDKPKIHLNPNFLRSNQKCQTNTHRTVMAQKETHRQEQMNFNARTIPKVVEYEPKRPENTTMVSKSRYSFVRQMKNTSAIKAPAESNRVTTIKISKYKSVSLKHIMQTQVNNTNNVSTSSEQRQIQIPSKTNVCPITSSTRTSRYKLVKHIDNNKTIANTTVTKISRKSLNRSHTKLKLMKKGNYKKNNIPCPLYRKFGKCLRNIKGKCDFLHDRKHISICPKFLKGICHNKKCLLSHEMTQQKMPTCYFYLQGTCIKDECPYLHVKLSDNVKLCPDFLKGYCEKGSNCIHRHDNVKKIRNKIYRTNSHETKRPKKTIDISHKVKNKVTTPNPDCETTCNERYYLEKSEPNPDDSKYEVIKPTRCKLGNLPSFIQI